MVLALPFAVIHIHNIIIGTTGYLLFVIASHILLNLHKKPINLSPVKYTPFQILLRAVFVGLTISSVVVLSSVLNPFWGGVFAMFPSVTFSSLIIFHYYYYSPEQLFYFMKKAPIGSLSLYAYDISAMVLFKKIGFIAGSFVCVAISLIVSWTLSRLQNIKRFS